MSHSYNHKIPYPIDSVVFKERKSCMGINVSTDNLKATSNPQNGAPNSAISGITTPFSLSNTSRFFFSKNQ